MVPQRGFTRRGLLKAGTAAAGLIGLAGSQAVLPLPRGGSQFAPLISAEPIRDQVLSLSIGSGQQQIGLRPEMPDRSPLGPESFAIHDGKIYILDTLNRRCHVLEMNGTFHHTISIDRASWLADIQVVSKDELWVLDTGADCLVKLNGVGSVLLTVSVNKEVLSRTYQIQADWRGDIWSTDVGGTESLQLTRNGLPVPASQQKVNAKAGLPSRRDGREFVSSYKSQFGRNGALKARTQQGTLEFDVPIGVNALLGGFRYLGTDQQGNVFVLVDEVQDSFPLVAEQAVRKYSPDGRLLGIAHIPLDQRYAIARRNVVLGEDGQIYCFIAFRDKVTVSRLGLDGPSKLAISHAVADALSWLAPGSAEAAIETRPSTITRSQCMDIAFSYWSHTWWCSLGNYLTYGGSVRPSYISDGGYNRNYYEVPYSYGGFDSLSGFDGRVNAGVTAGNTGDVDLSANCCGIDCSGFVCRCWGLPSKYGTCHLPNTTLVDKLLQLSQGDILNRAPCYPDGHVRLFYYYVSGGCYVYEAAESNGGRVYLRSYNWPDMASPNPVYNGYRYNGFS